MMTKIFEFESKKEKHIFFGIVIVMFLFIGSVLGYPVVMAHTGDDNMMGKTINTISEFSAGSTKTPQEYYDMFQCSCCGESIEAACCGMAEQRKKYVDELLSEGLTEQEILFKMVKKFGFDVLMDQTREQEIRDYIASQASENPPIIEISNPKHSFGTIKQSDGIVSTTFSIKNTGASDLIIDNMDTSCMCTSASLIFNGIEGPRFGMSMHGENPEDYELVIPSGETAELKVYYDPMAHGIQEKSELNIIREVTVISNDPVDFQKKVRIELTQIP